MIFDSSTVLFVLSCLRCWDESDEPIDVIWFNSDTMVASAIRDGYPQRTRVGRFCFCVLSQSAADQLQWVLPQSLHNKIEIT